MYGFLLVATILSVAHATDFNITYLSASEICDLVPSKVILRPDTCDEWIKCASSATANDAEEGSCAAGLNFDKDSQFCTEAEKFSCPYVVQTQKDACKNQADGSFVADNDNCNGYYFCKAGYGIRSTCPDNLLFNPYLQSCVFKEDYKCPSSSVDDYLSPVCRSIANNTLLADDEDCTKYHRCLNGVAQTYKCSRGTGYDYLLGECVAVADVQCHPTAAEPTPESTICENINGTALIGYFASNISCSRYYYCKKTSDGSPDRDPEVLLCKDGYHFDEKHLSCRDRVNVVCTADRCEGMGSKYVNAIGNCSAYKRCINGVSSGSGSCPAGYYFDERSQICTSTKITYPICAA